jgi:prepilin signal peptidase PulO-like enzyme (type II secretory pathway)
MRDVRKSGSFNPEWVVRWKEHEMSQFGNYIAFMGLIGTLILFIPSLAGVVFTGRWTPMVPLLFCVLLFLLGLTFSEEEV